MIVLKKKVFLPESAKRWLFECGNCHSEMLLKEEDFETYTYPNLTITSKFVKCPVCGRSSYDIDEDWIRDGAIKDIVLDNLYGTKILTVTDYDNKLYLYAPALGIDCELLNDYNETNGRPKIV